MGTPHLILLLVGLGTWRTYLAPLEVGVPSELAAEKASRWVGGGDVVDEEGLALIAPLWAANAGATSVACNIAVFGCVALA